jgi:methylmalonyl-CoA/ethylmalonyl-CoA epimerase
MAKTCAKNSLFSSVHHIGILVKDVEKALEQMSALGIGPFETPKHGPPFIKMTYQGRPARFGTKRLVASLGNVEIELFSPEGEAPAMQEFLKNKGDGIHHLSFVVDDLDKELGRLAQKGIEVLESARWEGGGFAYLRNPAGGINIELIEF